MLGNCWFSLIAYRVLKYNLDTSSGNIRGDEPERKGDQGTKDWPLCSYSLTVPLIARPCLGSGSLMLQKVTSPRPPRSFLVLFSTSLRHWSQFSHILFSIGVAF